MSFIQIDQIDLHYEEYGDAGRSVLLLHGWGQNTEMMAFIGEFLKSHFHVYNLDLPGFGQSGEPDRAWGSEEYCDFVKHFSDTMGIEDPIIIGHSFGCRIAIQYESGQKGRTVNPLASACVGSNPTSPTTNLFWESVWFRPGAFSA